MELTDKELEKIRLAARGVEYGSITINISADSTKIDLEVNNRIRLERELTEHREPMDRKKGAGYRT